MNSSQSSTKISPFKFSSPWLPPNNSPLSTKESKKKSSQLNRHSGHQTPEAPRKCRPPRSRIFSNHVAVEKALQISFATLRTHHMSKPMRSHKYDPQNERTYFEQCFDVERRIGHGSFGEVFAVRSRENRRRYAVKRLIKPFTVDCLREVQKHELLPPHPNVVRFEKAWEERGRLYIQMELCETSLLEYATNNHCIPEAEVWSIFVDLLLAVDHLHSHDLVHLDIKPGNIFVTREKVCKLGDFGIVYDLKMDTVEIDGGDGSYMAPELLKVLSAIPTKAADIFSLGLTIFEVATDLEMPIGGMGVNIVRSGNIPEKYLQGISLPLQKLVISMLDQEPAQRPTAQQLLDHPDLNARLNARRSFLHLHHILRVLGMDLDVRCVAGFTLFDL